MSDHPCSIGRMAKRSITIGPVGRRVAANMVTRRAALRLTQSDLSEAVIREGRQLGRQAIAEIETLRRRVDVDDVSALAKALETTAAELMGEVSSSGAMIDPADTPGSRERVE